MDLNSLLDLRTFSEWCDILHPEVKKDLWKRASHGDREALRLLSSDKIYYRTEFESHYSLKCTGLAAWLPLKTMDFFGIFRVNNQVILSGYRSGPVMTATPKPKNNKNYFYNKFGKLKNNGHL